MAQWPELSYAQKVCVKSAGKLMQETGMLRPGSRVGVALSGGVDSMTLLTVLTLRRRVAPFEFDLLALHLTPGFDPRGHEPLRDWLSTQGIAGHLELTDHGPRAHSEENLKNSPCFYCAMLRRKRLFDLCRHYGLTHLAMGHNAEDLAATFFMNLIQTGRIDGLAMSEDFFTGRLRVIRPLLWVNKAAIRQAARAWGLPVQENPCPTAGSSGRDEIMRRAECLWQGDKRIRENVFNALKRWQLDLTIQRS